MNQSTEFPWEAYITTNAQILAGKPIIRGTRLPVSLILELMAQGWAENDLLENYPTLTREGIRACLAYACRVVGNEHVYPIAMS